MAANFTLLSLQRWWTLGAYVRRRMAVVLAARALYFCSSLVVNRQFELAEAIVADPGRKARIFNLCAPRRRFVASAAAAAAVPAAAAAGAAAVALRLLLLPTTTPTLPSTIAPQVEIKRSHAADPGEWRCGRRRSHRIRGGQNTRTY